MAAEYDVYAEQLYSVHQGLALYEPDPAKNYDCIRVGDVGFVQYGYFHRMFNVFKDEEDPINQHSVPDHFDPIPDGNQAIYHRNQLPAGEICSTSIDSKGTTLKLSA